MARVIVLDSFPLSCVGKSRRNPATVTDVCRQWVMDCLAAGNLVHVPAIAYYETLRELETAERGGTDCPVPSVLFFPSRNGLFFWILLI